MNNLLNKSEEFFNNLDLSDILSKIFHSKWQVLIITLISLLLGALYVFNISPIYMSSALIQVDSQLGSANSMQAMLGNLESNFTSSGQASPADIEIALLKSRFILESVIESLKLNVSVRPQYFPIIGYGMAKHNQGRGLVDPPLGLSRYAWGGEELVLDEFSTDFTREITYQVEARGNQYRVFLPDGTLFLKGQVGDLVENASSIGPHLKMRIHKIIANEGTFFKISVKHYEDILMAIAQNLTITDLGDKTKTKTGVLQLSLKGTNPQLLPQILMSIINFGVQRDIEKKSAEASKTLDFLNRQLPNVRRTLETAEGDLNSYRAVSGKIDISQEAKIILMQLSTIEQSIAELKLKKIELLQELTPEHPFIKALSQKQRQLQKEMLSLEKKIRLLPETDQKALSLERDVKVKDQLYLLLLNKIQQLQVIKAGTLSDIRILSQATVPIEPLPTHKSFILLISLFVGAFVGIAQVLVRDSFRKGVTDAELVERKLNIPTYAVVLYSEKQKKYNRRLKSSNDNKSSSFILSQSEPHDIAVEGIRSLRTMLQFSPSGSHEVGNVISILGASPHIGKSFIAINLAQMMVDAGKKTLLIDSDMRKGKIHAHVGLAKAPGLSEILRGTHPVEKCVYSISNSFDFIPTGSYPSKPTELLMMPKFQDIINKLKPQYQTIIIDTPPILAVSDGIIMARCSNTNLLVVGMGVNQMEELEITVSRIKKNEININGLVFNDGVNLRHTSKQYNYYYAYEAT